MQIANLDENNIFLDCPYTDRDEMFSYVSKTLLKQDAVTNDYLGKVIAREDNHPTGFQLRTINVAMPHVDPEFVKKNGLFVVTSRQGIVFKNAETDEPLAVNIVFGLLLKEADTHLTFLMKLASSFQNEALLSQILNSNSTLEVKQLLGKILI